MKYQNTYNFKQSAQRFTIRKLNIGLASVVFGALFYFGATEEIQAAEVLETSTLIPSQIEEGNPPKKSLGLQNEMEHNMKDNVHTNEVSVEQKVPTHNLISQSESATSMKLNDSIGQQSGTVSTQVIDTIAPNPPGVSHLEIGKNIIRGTGNQYRNMIVAWFPDGQMMWTKVGKNRTWMIGVPYETQMKLNVGDVVQVYEYNAANQRSEVAYVNVVEVQSPETPKPVISEPVSEVKMPQEEISTSVSETVSPENTTEGVDGSLVVDTPTELNEPVPEVKEAQVKVPTTADAPELSEKQKGEELAAASMIEALPESNKTVQDLPSKVDLLQEDEFVETPQLTSLKDLSEAEQILPSSETTNVVDVPILPEVTLEEASPQDVMTRHLPSLLFGRMSEEEISNDISILNTSDLSITPMIEGIDLNWSSHLAMEEGLSLSRNIHSVVEGNESHSVMTKDVPLKPFVLKKERQQGNHGHTKMREDAQTYYVRARMLPETGNNNESFGLALGCILLSVPLLKSLFKRYEGHQNK
ncbi:YSIRK-type signal peptide-containing protein [Staphylococcus hyicus]|uniref:YSIRK-type signal peptide-containing protein n=1 Tax=Staphylococcus hyicus TaxID=1284 RepID=UPI00208FF653|nr:YSIRK-type signal peptide-containing protein [Staphylococcus hyicus]MCO4329166.1 YSIRK-type signal peptide-containing protein [Staphylococcus hyicus]MCO4337027.1 YSIRK-type signal peptide-containing protein [Staphylococcus hyicus]